MQNNRPQSHIYLVLGTDTVNSSLFIIYTLENLSQEATAFQMFSLDFHTENK